MKTNKSFDFERFKEETMQGLYDGKKMGGIDGVFAPMLKHLKKNMRAKGYRECESILPLQRHALERQDVCMDHFIKTLFNDEDFAVSSKK